MNRAGRVCRRQAPPSLKLRRAEKSCELDEPLGGCLKSDKTTPHFTFKRLNGVLGKVDPSFKKEGKVLIFSTIVSPPL